VIFYKCHNCGSVHEIESIRSNLFYGETPISTMPAFQPRPTLRPGPNLLRREVITMLTRGLRGRPIPGRAGKPR
jgi:hypothetical protein